MTERFYGVDGEMSGADLAAGHRLIQIGVALDTSAAGELLELPELFVSLIGWAEQDLPWDARAERVHGIERNAVLAAPPAYEVDEALCEWLLDHGADPSRRRRQVMVGFNVGVFDGPFIAQALPKTHGMFARRYGDLNPLTFLMASSGLGAPGPGLTSSDWKTRFCQVGLEYAHVLGRTEKEHDAGTDALQALGAWRFAEHELARRAEEAAKWRAYQKELRLTETAELP